MPLRSECSPDACPRFDPWRRKIFDDESEKDYIVSQSWYLNLNVTWYINERVN